MFILVILQYPVSVNHLQIPKVIQGTRCLGRKLDLCGGS